MTARIDIITLFPDMFQALQSGITGRESCRQQLTMHTWNPRQYSDQTGARVDDRPFGGGPGMLMQIDPLKRALEAAKAATDIPTKTLLLSPCGKPLNQKAINQMVKQPRIILIAGRYKGIDQRFIDHCVDECWSVGDFVVSGGELPAMLLIDALCRQLPGVVGNQESVLQDSFMQGLLDCPHYTRPAKHDLGDVPQVLIDGDHQAIAQWRQQQSLIKTWQQRPDMLKNIVLSVEKKDLLAAALLAANRTDQAKTQPHPSNNDNITHDRNKQ